MVRSFGRTAGRSVGCCFSSDFFFLCFYRRVPCLPCLPDMLAFDVSTWPPVDGFDCRQCKKSLRNGSDGDAPYTSLLYSFTAHRTQKKERKMLNDNGYLHSFRWRSTLSIAHHCVDLLDVSFLFPLLSLVWQVSDPRTTKDEREAKAWTSSILYAPRRHFLSVFGSVNLYSSL